MVSAWPAGTAAAGTPDSRRHHGMMDEVSVTREPAGPTPSGSRRLPRSGRTPGSDKPPGPSRRPPAAHVVHRGPGPLDRRGLRWLRVDATGVVLGTAFALLAMTPSLIPRDWAVQGLASGLSGAVGYGLGATLWWVLRRTRRGRRLIAHVRLRTPAPVRRVSWTVLLVAAPVAVVVMLLVAASWQDELTARMNTTRTTGAWLLAAPAALLVAAVPIALVRLVRHLDHVLTRGLLRFAHLPRRVAAVVAFLLVAVVTATLVNSVALRAALTLTDEAFSGVNEETYPGDAAPTSPTRSGSPGSLVPWATLGKEGRAFVSSGLPPAALAEAGGRPARGLAPVEPVRAYVGLESAPDAAARAELAVAELDRAGAFSRSVLAVVTTTGTGWVDDPVADGLEAISGGDSAVVATQYSYLPSWMSFLVDRPRAEEDGRLVFDAVSARVAAVPPGRPRPRLIAFGESLGSQGSESAFSSPADVRAQADGALWVGPPHSNRLWSTLVERRDPGSGEIRPVYADGLVVRFAGGTTTPAVASEPASPWLRPRVLYLQHPSDPVVWWSPELLWNRPDWLVEPPGDDVLGAMSWYPVVTFWQVSVDLANSVGVPDRHGHVYRSEMLDGWATVAAPDGWTAADTARAREVLAR